MTPPELEEARTAARRYLQHHGFATADLDGLEQPPILGPVPFTDADGETVTAYRWLGAGRGESYVQAEVGAERIVVHGAHGDRGLPPTTTRRS